MDFNFEILLMKFVKLIVLLYIFLYKSQGFAQNYNINFVPIRVVYLRDEFSRKKYIEPLFLYKYLELERKFNFGIAYNKSKEKNFSGYSRDLFYKLEPSIRLYFNRNKVIGGFYLGSGFNYYRYSYLKTGLFTGDDSLIEKNLYRNYINYSIYGGYKFSVINKRFSIDLKFNDEITIFNHQKAVKIFKENVTEINNFKFSNGKLEYPYLDLKLGYRFGFKK